MRAKGNVTIDKTAIFDAAERGWTVSTAEAAELTDILNRVTTWPTTLRIRLARKILESVDQVEAPAAPPAPQTRGSSSTEVQELPKRIFPSPDDEVARFLKTIVARPGTPPPRNGSLKDLLGILKTDGPAGMPGDSRRGTHQKAREMNVLLDTNVIFLQIACAVEANLDAIVTRNPGDFTGAPIPVLTPAELLALLAKAPDA